MGRSALVTYSCDGPRCDTVTVSEDLHFAPEEWHNLAPPDVPQFMDADQLQFCTTLCLLDWVHQQTHPSST
jgi:hypothetical protein